MSVIAFPISVGVVARSASHRSVSPNEAAAWEKYLAARRQAEKSGDIHDGIAAGKAWSEFMRLFVRQNGAER